MKLTLARNVAFNNFRTRFVIHAQETRRCIINGIKKIIPSASCRANPVILGDSNNRKIIKSEVSKQIISFLREAAVIFVDFRKLR